MRLEILFQFVVPLMFLAIWALTSLLNRDTQPLPQRPTRPGARPGPGPGPTPGQGPNRGAVAAGERGAAAGTAEREAARQAVSRTGGERRPAATLNDANVYVVDDEVVFVDPVTNRRIMSAPLGDSTTAARGAPKPPRPAQAPSQPRKPGRGRRAQAAAPPPRTEPETRRALSDQVGRSMSLSRSRPLDLTPLSSKLTPLTAAASSAAPARDLGLELISLGPALVAREVKEMLGSPPKLRETILLAEVLQPPVALRRRRRGG
jgi:hypothetical protein